ncbi:hypothetical protein ACOMHN_031784 [Nucella lapillus]
MKRRGLTWGQLEPLAQEWSGWRALLVDRRDQTGPQALFTRGRTVYTEEVEALTVDVENDVGGFKGRVVEVRERARQYLMF